MRRRFDDRNDGLWIWVWGAIVAVVVAAVVVLAVRSSDDEPTQADVFGDVVATAVDRLGERGTGDGEGLTPTSLSAASGVADTTDGGAQVPTGTVDGPGRRIFGGVTVRLPAGRTPLRLRQIVPEDLGTVQPEDAFVRWTGYVAVLTPAQAAARTLPTSLAWRKAEGAGALVPAGATVRLRTMFRVPASAGRCLGGEVRGTPNGHRTRQVLRRAPAWMVRRGDRAPWSWLRMESRDLAGVPAAVRSGPTRPATFRGSHVCTAPQTSASVDPDPNVLDRRDTRPPLPLEPPDAY